MSLEARDGARFVSGFSVNLPPGKPAGLTTPATQLAQMPGAVSGRPCAVAADRTIAELYRRMDQRRYRIIGSGGVFDAADAYRKIRLGASLVQLMTALIYEGPGGGANHQTRLGGSAHGRWVQPCWRRCWHSLAGRGGRPCHVAYAFAGGAPLVSQRWGANTELNLAWE